ncbi:MAG: 4Fe-4S dicluster domain-containing protein [Desulfobacterales bacterium]|nr:MAG: 4Fe-4S dicluster domain-containing protein [Desulfobacterales bacterium]
MSYFRVNQNCDGCLACVENCPASALGFSDRDNSRTLKHNMTKCARCGQCWRVCPQKAIEFQHLLVGHWDDVVTMDLIRCQVCGEPLYSTAYRQKVASQLNSTAEAEALCPQHRQRQAASKWPLSRPGRTQSTLGG